MIDTSGYESLQCLDLFAGLGGFSAAFAEADGWDVVTVDIDELYPSIPEADL